MPKVPKEVSEYLAEIGRKGGKKSKPPNKKYESDAERQRAYRLRRKQKENKDDENGRDQS